MRKEMTHLDKYTFILFGHSHIFNFYFLEFFIVFIAVMYAAAGTLQFPHWGIYKANSILFFFFFFSYIY